jgi:hypothetical protein
MKYFKILILFSFLFSNCQNNDVYNCNSGVITSSDNLKIRNTLKIKYSKNDIESILKISRNKGLKEIDSVQVGILFIPAGIDSNLIFVYEKECFKNNNRDVRRRMLSLKIKDWNRSSMKLSDKFEELKVYTEELWQFKVGKNIINVHQDESIDYDEVKEILDLINSGNYILECDVEDLSPQKDIEHISNIVRENNKYNIGYSFYGRWPTLVCFKRNGKLIIRKIFVALA